MTLPRVVITGMGVVSPNGIGKEAFCLSVLAGKSGVKRITRFDPSELPVQIAGEIPEFDELAWVDARERKHVSRVVPLAVAASNEAIKDAGLDPTAMSMDEKREIGVILGTGGGAQEFAEEQYRLWHSGHFKQVSLFCIPSGTMGTIPSEISMRFGFRGYSHVVTAGCTSSTDALGYAYQHIQAGVQPMFLVGGVDSPITAGIIKGYTLLRALTQSWNHAPERASRPFSADRDGFVIAEGSWMFILEDYVHARARGARIYAEITGYASTCEAFHRVRLRGTSPVLTAMKRSNTSLERSRPRAVRRITSACFSSNPIATKSAMVSPTPAIASSPNSDATCRKLTPPVRRRPRKNVSQAPLPAKPGCESADRRQRRPPVNPETRIEPLHRLNPAASSARPRQIPDTAAASNTLNCAATRIPAAQSWRSRTAAPPPPPAVHMPWRKDPR